jgi:LuxR family maltose regulon positive regulatory protein
MAFLLDHLPPHVHVVISSRADPGLPLSRLRARGELVEIRAADLRFTGQEADVYLNDLHSLGLEPPQVAALETRTEGWAAALQLAALSLHDRDDTSAFIAGFTGDDRYVVDYLIDEVLGHQSSDVRRFLLDTAVLEQLTPPLCDAVTGRSDSGAMLELLERQNLFLVPLDSHRSWYRYHHLFRDVLLSRLLAERPGDAPHLHRRASDWYDEVGEPEPAVRHALAAGDVDLAAARAEAAIPVLLRERREAVVCHWVEELPEEIVHNRPVLAVGFVAALAESNRFDGLATRLDAAERLVSSPPADQVVADQVELARLPASISLYRAALALVGGDLEGTITHAERAIARAPEGDRLTVASASAVLGLAALNRGDLRVAHRAYRTAAETLGDIGHVADVLGCSITLGDIEIAQGKLGEARRTYQRVLDLADGSAPRGTADMYVGLSRIALERGDRARAASHLREADRLGEAAGLPQNPARWRIAMACLRYAEGDPATAIALLDEAEGVYVADFNPDLRPIAAIRARIQAASGDVAAGLAWARAHDVSADDALSFAREYEHITLVRVLLAHHARSGRAASLADAGQLVDRLLEAAEAGDRTGVVIELLVLQALAHEASGQSDEALASWEHAVQLGEPDGYVRVFEEAGAMGWSHVGGPGISTDTGSTTQELTDPLSSRELDVLRYLGSELDGPAIARELGVSLATVRTHTQHIYTKLGVNNRRAAVRRAHQLNLFSRSTR